MRGTYFSPMKYEGDVGGLSRPSREGKIWYNQEMHFPITFHGNRDKALSVSLHYACEREGGVCKNYSSPEMILRRFRTLSIGESEVWAATAQIWKQSSGSYKGRG